jgi:hypothetical protein
MKVPFPTWVDRRRLLKVAVVLSPIFAGGLFTEQAACNWIVPSIGFSIALYGNSLRPKPMPKGALGSGVGKVALRSPLGSVDRNHASGFHFPPPVEAQHRNSFDFAGFFRRLSGNTNPPHQQQRQHNRIERAKEQRRVGGTYRRRSRSGLVRPASQFDPTLSMVNKLSTWHIRARLASPPAETEAKSAGSRV